MCFVPREGASDKQKPNIGKTGLQGCCGMQQDILSFSADVDSADQPDEQIAVEVIPLSEFSDTHSWNLRKLLHRKSVVQHANLLPRNTRAELRRHGVGDTDNPVGKRGHIPLVPRPKLGEIGKDLSDMPNMWNTPQSRYNSGSQNQRGIGVYDVRPKSGGDPPKFGN